jgi:asparagine N-glycosylation enzyme membrane subunit Stt3
MNKQERINTIYRYQQRWLLLRSILAILIGGLVVLTLQSNGEPMFTIPLAFTLTIMLYVIGRERRFVRKLTSVEQAKRIIDWQYVSEMGLLVLLAILFPLIVLIGWPGWSFFVVFLSGVILLHFVQKMLDRQISEYDADQPMRREIKLDFVKD